MNCDQRVIVASFEALPRRLGAEDGAARAGGGGEVQQAAVLRVEFSEEPVVECQARGRRHGAADRQLQHAVGAVGVAVDQLLRHVQPAGLAVGLQREAGQRIGGDLGVFGAGFAPGDAAVAIGIEADREVEVAQGDVPLAAEAL
ncbi:hypothetical protein [Rhizobacter sp. J219]|uniref:hypothetical protein n=1 Tax=Rhizobacter sp. J219 TaxID=2898430 RepID=UPI0027E37240|nr:hypothetical protein [Rhizobacter sp. J219]